MMIAIDQTSDVGMTTDETLPLSHTQKRGKTTPSIYEYACTKRVHMIWIVLYMLYDAMACFLSSISLFSFTNVPRVAPESTNSTNRTTLSWASLKYKSSMYSLAYGPTTVSPVLLAQTTTLFSRSSSTMS